jgi:hypothetical protein
MEIPLLSHGLSIIQLNAQMVLVRGLPLHAAHPLFAHTIAALTAPVSSALEQMSHPVPIDVRLLLLALLTNHCCALINRVYLRLLNAHLLSAVQPLLLFVVLMEVAAPAS